MTKLSLVLIIGIVIAVLIVTSATQLGKLIDEFCAKYPQWCGKYEEEYPIEYYMAKESTEQLACAIASTVYKKDMGCYKKGDAIYTDVYVECKFPEAEIRKEPSIWERIKRKVTGEEKEEYHGCRVYNFVLPQNVSDAKKWIAGFGDPKFLMYYEQFPMGEEKAWTGYSSWFKNVGTVVIWAMPVSKIFKAGKSYFVGKIKDAGRALTSSAKEGIEGTLAKLGLKAEETEIMAFSKTLDRETRRKILTEKYGKQFYENHIRGRIDTETLKTAMKTAGVLTPVALAGAILDSFNEKYYRIPHKLILKQPFTDVDKFTIGARTYDYPIMLNKDDDKLVNLYLVSPCEANLTVTLSTAFCQNYTKTDKGIHCISESQYDACMGSIYYLVENEKIPPVTVPQFRCMKNPMLYIPRCGNEDTVQFDLQHGIIGTNNQHCYTTSVQIKVDKEENLKHSSSNFCFTKQKPYTKYVFVGTIIAQALITYFSGGLLTEVGIGLTGGILYVLAEQVEEWP